MKKKLILITLIFFVLFGMNIFIKVRNPFNTGINPLQILNNQEKTGQRLEISFSYDNLLLVASNQFAFWIEDLDGNYINTLFVTRYTAQVGHRRRPLSIPRWVSVVQPGNLRSSEINAISGATPRPGNYFVSWDFTDENGITVAGNEFRYFIEATMFMYDDVLYSGTFTVGNDIWEYYPVPEFSIQNSEYKDMITNVRIAYYPD